MSGFIVWPSRAIVLSAAAVVALAATPPAVAQAAGASGVEPAGQSATAPDQEGSLQAAAQAMAASTWERVSDMDAWRGPAHWRIAISPYTYHWRYSPEHQPVSAFGLERQYTDRWLLGAAYFTNSFGQPSGYLYLGQRYANLLDQTPLFFQWSLGILYGYTGKYASKVPMNIQGFSPGALVGLGWQVDRNVSVAFHLLGDAGVMFQFAYDLR